MMYNFSPKANDMLAKAQIFARKYNNKHITSIHLLAASLHSDDSLLVELLTHDVAVNLDVVLERLKYVLEHHRDEEVKNDSSKLPLHNETEKVLSIAKNISNKMDHSFIGTEHLTLAMVCHTDCIAFGFLYENNVDLPGLASAIRDYLDPQQERIGDVEEAAATGGSESAMAPGEALEMFSVDMTKLAKDNELDPVLHRENEIERVMQVLCRRQKNNPVLVGEPGVGKTAIVEGLCNLIAADDAPLQLKDKQIYNLDLSLMVAGTKFRGQFEERMKQVMDDLLHMKNVIVFIDEIHMLVGAGNADGAMDAANILKPALSRRGISCIGTTTFDEYREFIEADGALERRFQKIIVNEPDMVMTIDILHGLKHKYEEFHGVDYTSEAIELAAQLSERYITDRFFPDKAIDVIDECAARIRLSKGNVPSKVKTLQLEIDSVREDMKEQLQQDDYLAAAAARLKEKKLMQRKRGMVNNALKRQNAITITGSHIRTTVSSWCGIPLEHLKKSESRKLVSLEKNLNKHVMGQSKAVQVICDSVIRGRTNVGDPDRPVGSFLLMGPTGVGKTYLAKQLAKYIFADEDNMIRVDMSELMEAHSVSKLIGSPPGYVGYGEGGQLTEQVRNNPYCVVLFDEVEKAHPDVMQLLLQLLDEGQLTDSRGVTINFKNCVVLMTSNIGAERMQRNHVVGFGASDQDNMDEVRKLLLTHLRPEFVNRLDEIVIFNSLDEAVCKRILETELKKFTIRMDEQSVKLKITTQVKAMLLKQGFDKKYGARPLRRVIQSRVQTPVAKFLLENEGPVEINAILVDEQVSIQKKAPA